MGYIAIINEDSGIVGKVDLVYGGPNVSKNNIDAIF